LKAQKQILHVVHSLEVGGLENGLINLLNRLDPERFKQTVCCLTRAGKFAERIQASGVEIIELNLPAEAFRFPLLRLVQLFRKLAPDIVHTRGWPTVDAVFAAWLARVPHIVHGEHGREHSDAAGNNWKRNQIRRLIGYIVDRYVVVCDFFRPWLRESCGVGDDRIIYIPNGVDTKKFYSFDSVAAGQFQQTGVEQQAPFNLRDELGLAPDTLLLGSVGRLDPVKDFPTLLRAFRQVRHDFPKANLVIVGDGPIRSDLARLTGDLGLQDSVKWLGESADVPAILRCCDLFVQTSIFEGMSNTILEAMASGLPIIATDTGGNPELVHSGKNGTLIRVGDVEKLTSILHKYLVDSALRTRQGLASRSLAVNQFDLALMATRYAELYETLGNNTYRS
jgi:sugar transferase (PEP-CTERM/EpsH1 system associated)